MDDIFGRRRYRVVCFSARTTRDVRRVEVALDMALGYVRAHAVTL
jgi:hypothetical protein